MAGYLFIALVVAAPFLAEGFRRVAHLRRRETAPGTFAELPMGRTHFKLTGPEDGPLIVCIHGLSSPHYIFAATSRALSALGFRVLVYDLYGRGFSASPRGRQNVAFFLGQLNALLRHLEVREPIHVLGYSMGGGLAAAFAARTDLKVSSLTLLAPAGLLPVYSSWRDRIWTLPLVGDWLWTLFGGFVIRRELAMDASGPTMIPDLYARLAAETHKPGYLPALLSSRRHVLATTLDDDHRKVAARGIPVLALWGRKDKVIRLRAMGRLAELNGHARHVEFADGTHMFPQTHPAKVADALGEFYRAIAG